MAYAIPGTEPSPILEMNTTPLIDVLLVLLVMFIITLPIQTHAVKVDLPSAGVDVRPINPVRNDIVVTDSGQILWNGSSVTKPQLESLLVRTQAMNPLPELHLKPEANARYALVDQVLAISKRAKVGNMGFVGNEAYASF